jgi:hypothetical protein
MTSWLFNFQMRVLITLRNYTIIITVFVTDGASMTSTSTQNPSLTYMALTARAANYALAQMKRGEL